MDRWVQREALHPNKYGHMHRAGDMGWHRNLVPSVKLRLPFLGSILSVLCFYSVRLRCIAVCIAV